MLVRSFSAFLEKNYKEYKTYNKKMVELENETKVAGEKSRTSKLFLTIIIIIAILIIVSVLVLIVVRSISVRNIFPSKPKGDNAITDNVIEKINELSIYGDDLVLALSSSHLANIEQETDSFGIAFGYSPDNLSELYEGKCFYSILADDEKLFCTKYKTKDEVESWIITGINHVEFDEIQKNAGYAVIIFDIPKNARICTQRYKLKVECSDGESSSTWFDINIVEKGIF